MRDGRMKVDFGWRLRVMRAARGMTQIELCEMVGVARSTMWTMENGFRPTPEIEEALREVLDWGVREDEALAVLAGETVAEAEG